VNIVLDPVFIFALHLNIVGAAVATMLSAWLATAWFLLFMYRKKRELAITLNPAYYTLDRSIALQTVLTGLPNFVISSMATLSNSVLNTLIAAYSNKALAGIGIAKKIDLLAFAIAQGVTQGTLPLISYNYAAKNKKRMLEVIKATALCGLLFACCGLCLLMVSAAPLSRAFIADAETAAYSRYFLRVISLTCPSTTLTLLSITVFQATGKKVQPIFLSALRKGLLDIPLMFLLNHFFAVKGLAWAIPAADIGAMVIALSMVVPHLKRLDKHPLEQAQ
jgi:Na+-driven multidrug efflux pump